ncbi:MAG: Nif3-like dinuclear metal center hexameric protein [Oscillospiraceae bacterium]|nr:Nif3-like dinuclear metal center hexameric protein [Oscillospiraceae bacterium]
MATVREMEQLLYAWAPKELAASWDNVGLLVGDPETTVQTVLVALDITQGVVEEAAEIGAELIVAHHPVMNCAWHPVQTLREDDPLGKKLRTLVRENISAICMHTNLDAAEGGVNDVLAEKLGLTDVLPLGEDGIGRIGALKEEKSLAEYTSFVVKSLGCNGARVRNGGNSVRLVAVGGGACGSYIAAAKEKGCDTFVTSDLKYNDFLDTEGLNLIDAGHFPTENVICPVIAARLREAYPHLNVVVSASHKEALEYYMN